MKQHTRIRLLKDLKMYGHQGRLMEVLAHKGDEFDGEYRQFGSKTLMVGLKRPQDTGDFWLSDGDWEAI